ncbi:aldose epimerase family protein [Halalkalibacter krulwichiae]|uniref:Aldose 1-epimerase n=1 Tax=Halalkalibacter krulwichiae TaxID=199441 RepID=A0A1X9MBU4_9BACI|nr:aldose epimerase family protein [Halalkalibacter krulwichiae]ARK30868.1 Aldose 1-epimerase precursor [Halalkalibacter krulwichiae]
MKITQEKFGELHGNTITSYTMKGENGLEVSCINYGCIITKIITPDQNGVLENIVLGFDTIEDYENHSPYFGTVVGRVAGRIKGGHFELEGRSFDLEKNEGDNHLHGGGDGFSHQIWSSTPFETEHEVGVEFSYRSIDGEGGYPGNLDVKVKYTLTNTNELTISYFAESDQTTLVNLTNHTYFNLSGNLKRNILNHHLTLKSEEFLELGEDLLPTGEVLSVENTPFDFRDGRLIESGIGSSHEQIQLVGNGYDHPFLLKGDKQKEIELKDEISGRILTVKTDNECVVLYSSNQMATDFEIRGVPAQKYLGLCLETQEPPDSIHHPHFTSCILPKGEGYRRTTSYMFLS